MFKPLIIITGPTACGKTDVSVKFAQKIGGEIISADSMQVYKYMDIGTAKIKKEETQGIKHYLIDELYPNEEYSAAVFKNKAKDYIDNIYERKKVPIVVGGTGFYINALIYDNDFSKVYNDYKYRNEIENIYKQKGNMYIYEMLKKVDYESAEKIHPNNVKRIIRALEFYKQTGKKISEHNEFEKKRKSPYNVMLCILFMNKELLYNRINKRVDLMLKEGLLEEVERLLKMYDTSLTSMQGIGYKEIAEYFLGNLSYEDAVSLLKKNTRHFAKRQLTWFKHQMENAIWIDVEKFSNADVLSDYIYSIYLKEYCNEHN